MISGRFLDGVVCWDVRREIALGPDVTSSKPWSWSKPRNLRWVRFEPWVRFLLIFCLCVFQKFCTELKALPQETIKELAVKLDPVKNLPEVECFIHDMDTFYSVYFIISCIWVQMKALMDSAICDLELLTYTITSFFDFTKNISI